MTAKEFIKENYTLINGGEDYMCEHSGQLVGVEDIAEAYYEHKLKLLDIANVVGQSEQLKAFKNDETVALDGILEVKIVNIESKVLVKVIEDDTLMWVNKDRLTKKYSL